MGRFLTLAEAEAEPGVRVKHARIKAVSRAVEKLGRSYGQVNRRGRHQELRLRTLVCFEALGTLASAPGR